MFGKIYGSQGKFYFLLQSLSSDNAPDTYIKLALMNQAKVSKMLKYVLPQCDVKILYHFFCIGSEAKEDGNCQKE